jgi:Tfp pilus assembly protein PilF
LHPALSDAEGVLVLTERGKLALVEGKPDEAERWFRKAVVVAPEDYECNYNLFQCLRELGKEAEAKKYSDKVERLAKERRRLAELTGQIAENPKNAQLRCEAGIILLRQGHERDALGFLETALQQDPQYRPAHLALAGYYERVGRLDLARLHRRFLR